MSFSEFPTKCYNGEKTYDVGVHYPENKCERWFNFWTWLKVTLNLKYLQSIKHRVWQKAPLDFVVEIDCSSKYEMIACKYNQLEMLLDNFGSQI